MADINLDIETLSTQPDAVILTVGACKFDPYTQTATTADFYLRINVDEQAQLGRHIDENTVAWWGNQAADVRDEALSDNNRVSLEEFTIQLNRFVVGVSNIWCQGPVFDIVILENLYRQLGKPVPWSYWQIRDSRTLFGAHGDPRVKGKAGLHNALEDAKSQAGAVQTIYKNLNIQKQTR
jgi:hypothetical protein